MIQRGMGQDSTGRHCSSPDALFWPFEQSQRRPAMQTLKEREEGRRGIVSNSKGMVRNIIHFHSLLPIGNCKLCRHTVLPRRHCPLFVVGHTDPIGPNPVPHSAAPRQFGCKNKIILERKRELFCHSPHPFEWCRDVINWSQRSQRSTGCWPRWRPTVKFRSNPSAEQNVREMDSDSMQIKGNKPHELLIVFGCVTKEMSVFT
jgi:hypothetical protein